MDKENNSKKRVIDPDDYDLTSDIHGDPITNPPTPYDYRNDNGEYDLYHEAYWIAGGIMRKDKPRDYTIYLHMWSEYQNTTTYKLKVEVYERYKERLKTCKTYDDRFKALMDYKKVKYCNNNM